MSDETFAKNYLQDLGTLLPRLDARRIGEAIATLRAVRDNDKTVYICGNGGSASIASQMVVDIVKGASLRKKKRFKMIGLTDSLATITAYANDEGYESVFVEPLKNFRDAGRHQGSGNSPTVPRRRICQRSRLHD
jgi:D-sedoheptulose 7-phosphate isomerase